MSTEAVKLVASSGMEPRAVPVAAALAVAHVAVEHAMAVGVLLEMLEMAPVVMRAVVAASAAPAETALRPWMHRAR